MAEKQKSVSIATKWTQEEIDGLPENQKTGLKVGDEKPPTLDEATASEKGTEKEIEGLPRAKGANAVTSVPSDDVLGARMERLKEMLEGNLSSVQYANFAAEEGRPKLKPVEKLRVDSSNPFSRPTIDNLLDRSWRAESNSIMTGEQLTRLGVKLIALGVPEEELSYVLWDASFYCKDASSSAYLDPKGTVEFTGGAISLDSLFACVRDVCTLRQFCRYFAPITWNRMNAQASPPSDWLSRGFSEDTKYAAFDCFDYVKNKACLQPMDGLFREPTKDEVIAFQTHKKIALDKNANNDRFANSSTEITGGKFGCRVNTKWRESSCN